MAKEKDRAPAGANARRELRANILASRAGDLGIKESSDCRRVWGVVVDWPVGDQIATVVALCDGNASLYTTSTFGVLGGVGHSDVRRAAVALVRDADRFHADGKATTDRSYPSAGRIRFHLLAFDGVRVVEDDQKSIEAGKNRYSALFGRAQDVLTELCKVTESRK